MKGGGANYGAVYVFKKGSDGLFTQLKKLTSSMADADGNFGHSVGLHGNRLIVGAIQESPNVGAGNQGGTDQNGMAHIYSDSCLISCRRECTCNRCCVVSS